MSDKTDEAKNLIFKGKFTAEEEEIILSGKFAGLSEEDKKSFRMARAFAGMCDLLDD